MEFLGLPQFKNRWQVEVTYKDGRRKHTFRVDELEDIDERIENGPDWRTIDKIVIILKKYVPISSTSGPSGKVMHMVTRQGNPRKRPALTGRTTVAPSPRRSTPLTRSRFSDRARAGSARRRPSATAPAKPHVTRRDNPTSKKLMPLNQAGSTRRTARDQGK